jgi:sugar phosphate isomerase/epimerase
MYPSATNHWMPELALAEQLPIFADQGWEGIELSTAHIAAIRDADDPERAAENARRIVDDLGLKMSQVHLLMSANLATADDERHASDLAIAMREVELAARAGIEVGVIHPGGDSPGTFAELEAEEVRRIESFARLCAHAAGVGFNIAVENTFDRDPGHRAADGRRYFGSVISELHELIDATGAGNFGICLDTGHSNVMGISMEEAVRQCGDRLIATHIDDNNGATDQHVCPGYGSVDWLPGMAALREIGWDGIFNIEIGGAGADDPDEIRVPRMRYALQITNWLLNA